MCALKLLFLLMLNALLNVAAFRRIINGTVTKIEDYPLMAAITDGEQLFCSAIILSDFWIATAAHCYDP
jgi:secreted trypsin-like serine protease